MYTKEDLEIPEFKPQRIELEDDQKCKKCGGVNTSPTLYTKKIGGRFFTCEFCERLSDENPINKYG